MSLNYPLQGCLALVSTEHCNFSYFPQDWDSKNTLNMINNISDIDILEIDFRYACFSLGVLFLWGT